MRNFRRLSKKNGYDYTIITAKMNVPDAIRTHGPTLRSTAHRVVNSVRF